MVKIVLDQENHRTQMYLTAEEERFFKAEANALGVSVQELMQAKLDAHAAKMFPDIIKPRKG